MIANIPRQYNAASRSWQKHVNCKEDDPDGEQRMTKPIRQQLGDAHLPLTRLRRRFFFAAKGIKALQYPHDLG